MDDAQLIKELGGPTKLAELLGYDKASGGVQRVANWATRGIPAKVKLDHPEIFLRTLSAAPATQGSSEAAKASGQAVDAKAA